MIKRILLIDVDVFDEKNNIEIQLYSHHPIGLLYLVSSAKESFPDIEFKVFHTTTSENPIKSIESLILSFNPDLVGLRAFSIAKNSFKKITETIRNLKRDVIIVSGGPYPSTSYNEILLAGFADIVVIGEGEATFIDLIGRLQKSDIFLDDVKGIAIIQDGKVRINEQRPLIPNIDIIPFPDYNYINLKDYVGIKDHALQDASKTAFIFSTRGCPYGCFYCHQLFGRKIRRRSAENVVAEMKEQVEKRGIYNFVFLDDLFNVPMPEAKKVLSLISRELPGIKINFPNGLRADQIDEEMFDLFEKAGTVEMALAVETVNPRLQRQIGKNLNVSKAEKAIHAASRRFITRLFFMIGFPSETFDEAMETIKFASSFEYAAHPTISMLRLYNNSKLFNILKPTEEQFVSIAEQEKKILHLEMFGNIEFYGDFFPDEKVPLKSSDIKELLYIWVRDVLANPNRIRKSHQILEKYLDNEKIIEFYRSIFNRPKFTERDLQKLFEY